MPRTLALLTVAAVAVVIGGCGDDAANSQAATTAGGAADSPKAQDYVDAMIESFDNADRDELQLDREQAQCLAPRLVDTIGPNRLAAAGIEPDEFSGDEDVDLTAVGLSEEDGNEMYEAFAACGIDVRDVFVTSMTAGMSEADADCLNDAIDEDLLRRVVVSSFIGGDEADDELADDFGAALSECPGLDED